MRLDSHDMHTLDAFARGTASSIPRARQLVAALLSQLDAQQQEIARLRAELDAARPGVEWRENPRPGSVDTWVCLKGRMALWVVVEFPAARKSRRSSGWWVSIEGMGVIDSGPETGDAGKAACYAAYLRACGIAPAHELAR